MRRGGGGIMSDGKWMEMARRRRLEWLSNLTDRDAQDSDEDSLFEELDQAYDDFSAMVNGLVGRFDLAVQAIRGLHDPS